MDTGFFIPKAACLFPLGGRLVTQMELYDELTDPDLDKRALALLVEPVLLAIEEKSAPQCEALQSAAAQLLINGS